MLIAALTERYREIIVSGVRLRYLEIEPAEPSGEPALLLLHALLATAESLAALILNLPTGRRMVALDIFSAELEDGSAQFDMRAGFLAELVRSFAQSIALERPVLIGHSYGGTLALRLAAAQDSEIRGLVLLCPAHPFRGYRSQVVSFYLTPWGRLCGLGVSVAPRWLLRRAYNQAAGTDTLITAAHLQPNLRVLRSRRCLRRVLQTLQTWEADMTALREMLLRAPIRQPALLIWGEQDNVVPLSSAAALQEYMPRSELQVLAGRGHLLADEAPEECGRLIGAWLRRFESRRPVQSSVKATQPEDSSSNSDEIQSRSARPRIVSLGAGD